jgi:hypothetical protein
MHHTAYSHMVPPNARLFITVREKKWSKKATPNERSVSSSHGLLDYLCRYSWSQGAALSCLKCDAATNPRSGCDSISHPGIPWWRHTCFNSGTITDSIQSGNKISQIQASTLQKRVHATITPLDRQQREGDSIPFQKTKYSRARVPRLWMLILILGKKNYGHHH